MNFKSIIKKLEKHRDQIGKDRDALSEYLDELTGLKESCDSAYDDIQRAIDSLSELA